MPTTHVYPGREQDLQDIADALGGSRRVVVITGAGISTNCGIPDFRSENGLYSMIQDQYTAALQNPPWEDEKSNKSSFDIDNRPKKKRKTWYYEVVAPDGEVVGVIDEEKNLSKKSNEETRPSSQSQSQSSNATTSTSRSSTPGASDKSSLSSCPSEKGDKNDETSCITICPLTTDPSTAPEGETSRPASPISLTTPAQVPSESNPVELLVTLGLVVAEDDSKSPKAVDPLVPITTSPLKTSALPSPETPSRASPERDPTIRVATPQTQSSPLSPPLSDIESIFPAETPNSNVELAATDTGYESPSPSSTSSPRSTPTEGSSPLAEDSSVLDFDQDSLNPKAIKSEDSSLSNLDSSQTSRTTLPPNLKGRDLFDAIIWSDPFQTSIFYMFISSLRQKVQEVTDTTESHKFLRVLRDGGRLVRNYTQNIDMLEEREGLSADLLLGPGTKGKKTQRKSGLPLGEQPQLGGCECVPLHGTLLRLRCQQCAKLADWDEASRMQTTLSGAAPDCPACSEYTAKRASSGRRNLGVGRLRPDIVLYGEENPSDDLITPIIEHDLLLGPDILLIMGTSLKVHGLKRVVREFAKAVRAKNGKVIFVNNTKPSESIWGEILDYWVQWDCDKWVLDLKERREDIWLPQGSQVAVKTEKKSRVSTGATTKPETPPKPWKPRAIRDEKANGAYVTFKILDTLRNVKDSEGNTAERPVYWPPPPKARKSTLTVIAKPARPPPKGSKVTKKPASSRGRKLALAKLPPPKLTEAEKARIAYLDNEKTNAWRVSEMWEEMRRKVPSLPPVPPELRRPFSEMKSNMPSYPFLKPFEFHGNQFPNIGGGKSVWPLDQMNLDTLPPTGFDPLTPSPKQKARKSITHGYGTRASGRQVIVEPLDTPGHRNGHGVGASQSQVKTVEPLDTPIPERAAVREVESRESQDAKDESRIKRLGSIDSLISGPEEEWHDAQERVTPK